MTFYKTHALYTWELLRTHPDKVFLFGDNLRGKGHKGQANIRPCRNSLGVPTKIAPSREPDAYFYDAYLDTFIDKVVTSLNYVKDVAEKSHIVVPTTPSGAISLGLGLATLDKNSPTTYLLICSYLEALADKHGGWKELQ